MTILLSLDPFMKEFPHKWHHGQQFDVMMKSTDPASANHLTSYEEIFSFQTRSCCTQSLWRLLLRKLGDVVLYVESLKSCNVPDNPLRMFKYRSVNYRMSILSVFVQLFEPDLRPFHTCPDLSCKCATFQLSWEASVWYRTHIVNYVVFQNGSDCSDACSECNSG